MGTWDFWCYMREVIEQYCGKKCYTLYGESITNHFAALISDEDMRSCCYPPEDDIRLWLKREGFCKGEQHVLYCGKSNEEMDKRSQAK